MTQAASAGEQQVVCIDLAGDTYAIDISRVNEIIRVPEITPIPRAPAFVEGVINLRGRIIPVLDLRRRLGLVSTPSTKASRVAIVEMADHTIGLVVDGVSRVTRFREDVVQPPSPFVAGVNSEYLRGIAKADGQIIILLDLDRVLEPGQNEQLGTLELRA
jgi:purine-binding chemotaxis protein CheW